MWIAYVYYSSHSRSIYVILAKSYFCSNQLGNILGNNQNNSLNCFVVIHFYFTPISCRKVVHCCCHLLSIYNFFILEAITCRVEIVCSFVRLCDKFVWTLKTRFWENCELNCKRFIFLYLDSKCEWYLDSIVSKNLGLDL